MGIFRRAFAALDRRARYLAEPCRCGHVRRSHLRGQDECGDCVPCMFFKPGVAA